ncbi:PAS domain-containing protein [Pseudomonas sp. UL073]|uniref:histidine kinase n=1 Tax=Zestomonas insulae TaxID=2809017 RepID=A0ABS2IL09_9GAMM|nr:ATP-binding protein [Pseudomonas insulae]MBM7062568.1 PAS domain-containing protein [Pseudomonas insulae]
MKLPMKLRTRMFLSISALITVALLGLLFGVVGVLQLARSQETVSGNSFALVEASQKLRQTLGDQMVIVINEQPDLVAWQRSRDQFRGLLDSTRRLPLEDSARHDLELVADDYAAFVALVETPSGIRPELAGNEAYTRLFNGLRGRLIEAQNRAFITIGELEGQARQRATLIAALLGLMGGAVLLIGVITANSVARRFGAPIDQLARAADQVGRGNYDVVLPVSPVTELALLSRRFGLMTEALRVHHSANANQLLSSEGRLKAVLDSIDDGLVILDAEGRVEHANPVATRQLFWQGDPHGQRLGRLLADPGVEEAVQRVLSGQLLEQVPADLAIDSGGEHRLLTWSLTPVQHAEGRSVGAVMVLRDVTELRVFERVRSEFVLRASHELRTPVTGMHMAFNLLRERQQFAPGSRELDLADTVDEEMQRLVQLINDLLNFSRYQNGLHKLERAPCDLGQLLDSARGRFAEQAAARQIQLHTETQGVLPRVSLDLALIERVLDNLLSNALRHSEDGGEVQLQARRHGERVILSVQDQGEGIPFGQQARIFEPFVQVGRRKGGVGLGLALSKEIVQLHGGRLNVYSRPGQGAQFYLSLPV